MELDFYDHRNGIFLLQNRPDYSEIWEELVGALEGITDEDILAQFEGYKGKSIASSVNKIIRDRLTDLGWQHESPIFQDPVYQGKGEKAWRLDFVKGPVSVEVGFNHGEAISWNLIKPVLASEMNHVRKAIQTEVAVNVSATEALKAAGGFDGAVGTFEKIQRYLLPLNDYLTVPLVLIGLGAPRTFRIEHYQMPNETKQRARVVRL